MIDHSNATTDSEVHAIRGIDASVYFVKDLDRAKAFWRDTMGLDLAVEFPSYAEFTLPDGATFGLYKMTDESWIPGNGLLFNVADVRGAMTEYKQKGVQFRGDDHIEESPICLMAFGEDSEGNYFVLHQHKE